MSTGKKRGAAPIEYNPIKLYLDSAITVAKFKEHPDALANMIKTYEDSFLAEEKYVIALLLDGYQFDEQTTRSILKLHSSNAFICNMLHDREKYCNDVSREDLGTEMVEDNAGEKPQNKSSRTLLRSGLKRWWTWSKGEDGVCVTHYRGRITHDELDSPVHNKIYEVPDKIGDRPVIGIGPYCFVKRSHEGNTTKIKQTLECHQVRMPETVRQIGSYAFYRSTMSFVELPRCLETIGDHAFCECKLLNGPLIIPQGVKRVGERAFCKCEKIKTIYVPSSLKDVGNYSFCCNDDVLIITKDIETYHMIKDKRYKLGIYSMGQILLRHPDADR